MAGNMKDFTEEISLLFEKFQKGAPFAFSKFADGEWSAMHNETLNNSEFENTPETNEKYRGELRAALQYQDPNYYIGTCCPCCNGDRAKKMREFSGQSESQMTFANVFVNSNYPIYKETFLKEYSNHDVHLVANEGSKFEELPFTPEKIHKVGFSAWVNNHSLIDQIKQENFSNKLFIFCCGPFGNMLCHQLHEANKNNIYIDGGSTLNPWLQSEGFRRDYYCEGYFAERKCQWE